MFGSCCRLKFSVDKPNGLRIRLPRSFNLPENEWEKVGISDDGICMTTKYNLLWLLDN